MSSLFYLLAGAAAFVVFFFFAGFSSLRRNRADSMVAIQSIELDAIEPLVSECIEVFRTKLEVRLDLDDYEGTIRKLDDAIAKSTPVKRAFERDGAYWYCVKPMGAVLGELLRRHAGFEWAKVPNESPNMTLRRGEMDVTVHPFEKVVKQMSPGGRRGDLVAYVVTARELASGSPPI